MASKLVDSFDVLRDCEETRFLSCVLFQVVRTSEPMNMLISGNSFASRGVNSSAVAVSIAFAKMVVMPFFGLSLATL